MHGMGRNANNNQRQQNKVREGTHIIPKSVITLIYLCNPFVLPWFLDEYDVCI